jgi:hypothetical protein
MWVLAAAAAVLAVLWLVDLRQHPFGRCWSCGGSGRNPGSTKKRYGRCRACQKRKGPRVRVGAKLVRPDLRKGN